MNLREEIKNVAELFSVIIGALALFFITIFLLLRQDITKLVPIEHFINQDQMYWFFSASAQTLAALVAFLMTGYALVINVMDNTADRDDSWAEILPELKRKYYKKFKALGLLTGLAICLSLIILWTKTYEFNGRGIIFFIIIVLDIVTIWRGISFALSIIDPDKYHEVASAIVSRDKEEQNFSEKTIKKGNFIEKFIIIEKQLRQTSPEEKLINMGDYDLQSFVSLGQIIVSMFKSGLIDKNLYNQLVQVNKYRNLIVHGQLEVVPEDIDKMLDNVIKRFNEMRDLEKELLLFLHNVGGSRYISWVAEKKNKSLEELTIASRNLANKGLVVLETAMELGSSDQEVAEITDKGRAVIEKAKKAKYIENAGEN